MLRDEKGFTLIEILIALAILAMIVASTFTIFRSSSQSWQKGETRRERYHNARTAVGRMSAEISQSVMPDKNSGVFIGNKNTVRFFSFVSNSGGIFELAQIEYWLNDKNRFLMRNEEILADNVSLVEFLYYDGLIWTDIWDSKLTVKEEALPKAVKIKIKVEDKKGKESEIFEVVTKLKTA
jgi:prepilin-type N-terminal cleavage/methylation domain-containing protein